MTGIVIVTEACIGTKDRACVDVCPVQCIYEFDPASATSCSPRSRRAAESSRTRTLRTLMPIGIFGDSVLYVNADECTSCTACYQPDVCPVGAIYSEERVPDGTPRASYNSADTSKGHDHTFFVQLTRDVFAD